MTDDDLSAEPLTDFYERYVAAQRAHAAVNGKTALAVLEMAKAVCDARLKLGVTDWHYFLRRAKLHAHPERVKAFTRVGKKYDVFAPFADHLPASLYTLNLLAMNMDTPALQAYVTAGRVHPMMTSLEATNLRVSQTWHAPKRNRPADIGAKAAKAADAPKLDALKGKPVGDYRISIEWYPASFTPALGRLVVKFLKNFLAKHGERFGLYGLTMSTDLEMSLLEDERETAA